MKVKISCPKCGSEEIKITSEDADPTPMYKCNKCKYKHRLFPKFESDENTEIEEDKKED